MSNTRTPAAPRNAEEALLCLFVETLSQQNRDLEAGLSMYLSKKGPPEERERLLEKAKAARSMYRKIEAAVAEQAKAR